MPQNPLNDIFQPAQQAPQRQSQGSPMQMLAQFRDFAKGMTPEQAQQQVQQLLASGKMSQQQFQNLQQQAKQFMQFLGFK